MYKLYIYNHCPYCVKAWMIFGLKKIPVQVIHLLNDDEKTPISMIGAKMVPILEKSSGEFMAESLDIVDYIDKLKNKPLVSSWKTNRKLSSWMNRNQMLCYELAMPRWVQAPLGEFQTEKARKYFQRKKEQYIGPFKESLESSKEQIEEMTEELETLESLFKEKQRFFEDSLTVNDFHLFAFLRSLSIVKGLSFPDKVKSYSQEMSKQTKIPLHHSIAL